MITRQGNIWDHHAEGGWIVITTNIGWKNDGTNPMGAGIAKTAADKYPELPLWYGKKCRKFEADTAVLPYKPGRLFLFPTKPLAEQPWMSWKQDSSLELIRQSTQQLVLWLEILQKDGLKFIKPIGVPMVGCQNGNLKPKQVVPILEKYLTDKFVLFERY
jgi:hypothetical protein